jgi:hypothetical protein
LVHPRTLVVAGPRIGTPIKFLQTVVLLETMLLVSVPVLVARHFYPLISERLNMQVDLERLESPIVTVEVGVVEQGHLARVVQPLAAQRVQVALVAAETVAREVLRQTLPGVMGLPPVGQVVAGIARPPDRMVRLGK